ncbi:MAG: hypothetical protein HYX62_02120 [Gammaproteobacteria bacterium]|nr:hypothetical protein [Gammaproteobacteria bacterium]
MKKLLRNITTSLITFLIVIMPAMLRADTSPEKALQNTEKAWKAKCNETVTPQVRRWEYDRAIFERDNDYSAVDDTDKTITNSLAKRYLVEARFHVTLSELTQVFSTDPGLVRSELRLAQSYLRNAQAAVESPDIPKIQKKIQEIEKTMASLEKKLDDRWSGCWAEQEKQVFESIRADIKDLIGML